MTVLDLFKEIDVGNCKAIEFYRPMTKAEVLQLADEVREHEDGVKSIKLVGTVLHREVHAVNDGDGMNSLAPVLGELLRKGCSSIELQRAWISDAGVDALVEALLSPIVSSIWWCVLSAIGRLFPSSTNTRSVHATSGGAFERRFGEIGS